jgi:hypothetical protein
VSIEAVDAVVVPGRHELPPVRRVLCGVRGPVGRLRGLHDARHRPLRDGVAVLDAVREVKPPFSPATVVEDFCILLGVYGISTVIGDRYGGEWCREPFRERGVEYVLAEKSKSELYGALLPAINSRRVVLLDNRRLVTQLCGLERRTAWGGRDTIDHGTGGHDDLANATAGALVAALGPSEPAMLAWLQAEEVARRRVPMVPGMASTSALAIAHLTYGRVVLDAVRERRPPVSPEGVVTEFARLLSEYRVTTVIYFACFAISRWAFAIASYSLAALV